ncbi:MAG: thiamine phosphate synthase [Candidatus Sumerlaeota bacterium]
MLNDAKTPAADLRLMAITDGSLATGSDDLLNRVEYVLEGGATAVMLREKGVDTRALYDAACRLRDMTSRHGALLIVNDRLDIAQAAQADGVHLGWRSLPVQQARSIAGSHLLIGASTHSIEEIENAEGADYVTFSPIFPTPSKEGLVEVVGLGGLREAVERFPELPVVALGGIDAGNAASVIQAGACGVAVIRAVLRADDPADAAEELLRQTQSPNME